MQNDPLKLKDMACQGAMDTFEDRWLAAVEDPDTTDRDVMLEALELVAQRGGPDRTATLGWTWLTTLKQQADPREALAVGKALLLVCGDSSDLREEVLELVRHVHADHPGLDMLIEASGLAGEKSARRALRTLDVCLHVKQGDFLIERDTDRVARITEIQPATGQYVVQTRQGTRSLDADGLALNYEPADANDFRVLVQQRPDEVAALADKDPAALVVGILTSRHGRIDADHLEALLSPRFIPSRQWSKWWSKARAALRRHPHVVVEGRSPVILTYHAQAQTLESEIEPQWAQAATPLQRLSVIETYFRECKGRRTSPQPAMIETMQRALQQRIDCCREGSPAEALAEALVLARLADAAEGPAEAADSARQILKNAPNPSPLLAGLGEPRLYVSAVELIRDIWPERWPAIYLDLLPVAPYEGCDLLAARLAETGRLEELRGVVTTILDQPAASVDAVCWLWRGPSVQQLEPIPRRALLPRILETLNALNLSDDAPAPVLRNARSRIRAALSADDYAKYREVIAEMDAGTAATVLRTVDRVQGLGQVVHATLKRIIRQSYPDLEVRKITTDPWADNEIIFCTRRGMERHNAQLQELLNVKIPENARAIGEAAAHGDLSENSEYKFALEERDLLRARVARIQEDLSRATVLTAQEISTEQVDIGTRAHLETEDGGATITITILGPWEADAQHRIYNYRAPLCAKLRGLKVGQTIALQLDDNVEQSYRVVTIENALAHDHGG